MGHFVSLGIGFVSWFVHLMDLKKILRYSLMLAFRQKLGFHVLDTMHRRSVICSLGFSNNLWQLFFRVSCQHCLLQQRFLDHLLIEFPSTLRGVFCSGHSACVPRLPAIGGPCVSVRYQAYIPYLQSVNLAGISQHFN